MKKIALSVVILLVLGLSFFFPEYAKYCEANNSQNHYCTAYTIAVSFGHFVEDHNGAISALATFAIAVFTLTLYITSREQGRLALQSIQLAREEFVATHRPHIVVYGFDDQGDGQKPHFVQFRYVNKGSARAYVTEIGSALIPSKSITMAADFTDFKVKKFAPPVEVKSGNSGFALTDDTIDLMQLMMADRDGAVFCAGYIIYRDDNGTLRRTGFCRSYDPPRHRWMKVEDEEYEYSY